jgi:HK97 family phage major capsid protein
MTDIVDLDYDGTVHRMKSINDEFEKLQRYDELTNPQEMQFERLKEEFNLLELHQIRLAAAGRTGGALRIERGNVSGPSSDDEESSSRWGATAVFKGDPWSDEPVRTFGRNASDVLGEIRGRARTAVERVSDVSDDGRQRITEALDVEKGEDLSKLARWAIVTSDPAYLSAFSKVAVDPQNGHREFDTRELAAFQRVQSEARAMSLVDSAGGFLVPFQLDPTVILTSSGSTNPLREIARTVVATGDVWNGVSSAGVSSNWAAEAAEANDDSPTFAQPAVPVHKQHSFIPVSIEAWQDMANGTQEIAKLLADESEQTDAEAFTVGTGTGQPTGIVTALTGTASEVDRTGTTLDAADFFAVQEALGPRFQPNAKWIMHLVSLNRGRSIIAGTGLTTPLLDDSQTPPRLLGKQAYEASFMDSTVTGSASDFLAVYGDFRNYVIADRVGTTVELIPHLFGATRRPTGQRGWYMFRRVGADSVNDNAFRMLDKNA